MKNQEYPVRPPLGPPHRYTVRIAIKPGEDAAEYRVVTALGELKAAALAALRLMQDRPEARFSTVEIVRVESDFVLDPRDDIRDYWGVE